MSVVKIIECPRDAMQGFHHLIPTETKIQYLNQLLKVGFDTLDFGSFVSPKAVPQMADTAEVLKGLDLSATTTQLLAIIANLRGAEQAASYEEITYIGFPLSVSEVFQQRNTNKSVSEALVELAAIQQVAVRHGKTLVVYLSMAFGNPYDETYHPDLVVQLAEKVVALGVSILAPSDTIGSSTPQTIQDVFGRLIPAFPTIAFGAHLHAVPHTALEKIEAAWQVGVRRFDGAIRGFGGCPMAADDLTGNIATETIVACLESKSIDLLVDKEQFHQAWQQAAQVFV